MNFESSSLLPRCLRNSVRCYTLVDTEGIENGPSITTCNTNGYIYEVRNQKILHSLDLEGENCVTISPYYLIEDTHYVLFYLVYTASKKLFLIRRNIKFLETVNIYEGVQDFDVYDFQCLGYPQIKIIFLNLSEDIVQFPVQDLTTVDSCGFDNEKGIDEDNINVTDVLNQKLQMIHLHIDELTEERNQLKKLCFNKKRLEDKYSPVVPSGAINFSTPLKAVQKPKISILNTWCKLFGKHFVFGMKILSKSQLNTSDLELFITHEKIKNYLYAFFSLPEICTEESFRPSYITSSINPEDEVFIVCAFQIPVFVTEAEISIKYDLIFLGCESLASKIHNLSVTDLAGHQRVEFEKYFTVEDWMSIMTLKAKTRLKIETKSQKSNAIESILVESLGFKKINYLNNKLFYCTSTYLNEVFIWFEPMAVNSTTQSIIMYTGDEAEIYFFVNALYDQLPDRATILVDDSRSCT